MRRRRQHTRRRLQEVWRVGTMCARLYFHEQTLRILSIFKGMVERKQKLMRLTRSVLHVPVTLASFLLPLYETQPRNLFLLFPRRSPTYKCVILRRVGSTQNGFRTAIQRRTCRIRANVHFRKLLIVTYAFGHLRPINAPYVCAVCRSLAMIPLRGHFFSCAGSLSGHV